MENIKSIIKTMEYCLYKSGICHQSGCGGHLSLSFPEIYPGLPIPYLEYKGYEKIFKEFPQLLKDFVEYRDFYKIWQDLSIKEKFFILNFNEDSYSVIRGKIDIKNLYLYDFPDKHNNIDIEKLCILLIKDVFDLDIDFPINKLQCIKLNRNLEQFINKEELDKNLSLFSQSPINWGIGLIKNIFNLIDGNNQNSKLIDTSKVSLYSMIITHKLLQTELSKFDEPFHFIEKEKQYAENNPNYNQDYLFDLNQVNIKYSNLQHSPIVLKSKSVKLKK